MVVDLALNAQHASVNLNALTAPTVLVATLCSFIQIHHSVDFDVTPVFLFFF